MHPTPNIPYIFVGKPNCIHTMYFAHYVDDFVYFSPNRETELAFEQKIN